MIAEQLSIFSICTCIEPEKKPISQESKQRVITKKNKVKKTKEQKLLDTLLGISKLELSYNEVNKKAYEKAAKSFLRSLAKTLEFKESKVHYNPAGIACAGDASLYGMWGDTGIAIYLEADAFQDLQIMYRKIHQITDYTGERNQWFPVHALQAPDGYIQLVETLKTLSPY